MSSWNAVKQINQTNVGQSFNPSEVTNETGFLIHVPRFIFGILHNIYATLHVM